MTVARGNLWRFHIDRLAQRITIVLATNSPSIRSFSISARPATGRLKAISLSPSGGTFGNGEIVRVEIEPRTPSWVWLFAGTLRAGQRAAAVVSLIPSAKPNRHDPYRYPRDVLERLPTHPNSKLDGLLPDRWSV